MLSHVHLGCAIAALCAWAAADCDGLSSLGAERHLVQRCRATVVLPADTLFFVQLQVNRNGSEAEKPTDSTAEELDRHVRSHPESLGKAVAALSGAQEVTSNGPKTEDSPEAGRPTDSNVEELDNQLQSQEESLERAVEDLREAQDVESSGAKTGVSNMEELENHLQSQEESLEIAGEDLRGAHDVDSSGAKTGVGNVNQVSMELTKPSDLTVSKLEKRFESQEQSIENAAAGLQDTKDMDPDEVKSQIKVEVTEKMTEAVDETIRKASVQGRAPTNTEVYAAVSEKLSDMVKSLWRRPRTPVYRVGLPLSVSKAYFWSFLVSVEVFDWFLLAVAFATFFCMYCHMLHWPSTSQYHWLGLLVWLGLAFAYFVLIDLRQGAEAGISWMNGYFLEMIFMTENVFVFHMVVKAFRSPVESTESALFVVTMCQVFIQMVFYMGLAPWLRSLKVLPYILGSWLVYMGAHSATQGDHEELDFDESLMGRWSRACFGGRVLNSGWQDHDLVKVRNGRWYVTRCGLLVVWLLVADALLEIDVTLAKIEDVPNQYLAFSSSVLATFAVPEVYFIAQDIFTRFKGLKYGISCVLVIFGIEMLLRDVVAVPVAYVICTMVGILLTSSVVSVGFGHDDERADCSVDKDLKIAVSAEKHMFTNE